MKHQRKEKKPQETAKPKERVKTSKIPKNRKTMETKHYTVPFGLYFTGIFRWALFDARHACLHARPQGETRSFFWCSEETNY
jgi:hypothetical protein